MNNAKLQILTQKSIKYTNDNIKMSESTMWNGMQDYLEKISLCTMFKVD